MKIDQLFDALDRLASMTPEQYAAEREREEAAAIATVTRRGRALADRADIGGKMVVRIDKKTTFSGTLKAARFARVEASGRTIRAFFVVTLVRGLIEREFTVTKLPTRG